MRESRTCRRFRTRLTVAVLTILLTSGAFAQGGSTSAESGERVAEESRGEGRHPFREPSLEAGAPFSLNAYDAVHALYLLRRELFLQVLQERGVYRTVRIRQVRAVRLPDAENPLTPFERRRYDILLNGEPLDWENSYIEYDERRVNMRLLYTYRNGGLPEGLAYEGPQ